MEQILLCLAQLQGGPPHLAAEATTDGSQPAHFDTMRNHLGTVRDTMQRAAGARDVHADDFVAALDLIDRTLILFHQMDGLGDYPLLPTFAFELLLIRVAIQARRDNIDLNLLQDADLRASAFPDMEPDDDWNRTRCARESVRMLMPRVEALRNGLPLLELVAEVEQPGTSISGTLIAQMLRVLTEAERTLSSGSGVDFDLAGRLARRLHVLVRQFGQLDPLLDLSGLIGAIDTCAENISEAALDPDGPRAY